MRARLIDLPVVGWALLSFLAFGLALFSLALIGVMAIDLIPSARAAGLEQAGSLKRFALEQARHVADEARGFTDEHPLERRDSIHRRQSRPPDRRCAGPCIC